MRKPAEAVPASAARARGTSACDTRRRRSRSLGSHVLLSNLQSCLLFEEDDPPDPPDPPVAPEPELDRDRVREFLRRGLPDVVDPATCSPDTEPEPMLNSTEVSKGSKAVRSVLELCFRGGFVTSDSTLAGIGRGMWRGSRGVEAGSSISMLNGRTYEPPVGGRGGRDDPAGGGDEEDDEEEGGDIAMPATPCDSGESELREKRGPLSARDLALNTASTGS